MTLVAKCFFFLSTVFNIQRYNSRCFFYLLLLNTLTLANRFGWEQALNTCLFPSSYFRSKWFVSHILHLITILCKMNEHIVSENLFGRQITALNSTYRQKDEHQIKLSRSKFLRKIKQLCRKKTQLLNCWCACVCMCVFCFVPLLFIRFFFVFLWAEYLSGIVFDHQIFWMEKQTVVITYFHEFSKRQSERKLSLFFFIIAYL